MAKLTVDMARAIKKDVDGLVARWHAAGRMADVDLRDKAIADYKDYVDMLASCGISLADVDVALGEPPRTIGSIVEYGLEQRLSHPVRCF